MKTFECVLEQMARTGNEKDGWNLEPDWCVQVWCKTIKTNGIMKAIKQLDKQHKNFQVLKGNIDKINPNHYRLYVSDNSNYYNDITRFELTEEQQKEGFGIGMVIVEVFEIRKNEDDENIRNLGYENQEDWQ